MSDSDEDTIPNMLRSGNTSAHIGYNASMRSMMGSRFQNNMPSFLNVHSNRRNNFGRREYDQRNIYSTRETSPLSMRSVPGCGSHNMHQSYYRNEMDSRNSVVNGRCGSSMSVRSIDTTTSVSAADIVEAFKSVKFNKYDLRLIKDAYSKFLKNKVRKRFEKRRKLKLLYKHNRRKSGYDSGEQGDSSSSSNDCRSIRSVISDIPKENILKHNKRKDIFQFKTTVRESDMYKDCTQNFKDNTFKNMCNSNGNNEFCSKSGCNVFEKIQTLNRANGDSRSIDTLCHGRNILPTRNNTDLDREMEQTLTRQNNATDYIRANMSNNYKSVSSGSILSNNISCQDKSKDFNFKRPLLPLRKPQSSKNLIMTQKDSDPEEILAKSTQTFGNMKSNFSSLSQNNEKRNVLGNSEKSYSPVNKVICNGRIKNPGNTVKNNMKQVINGNDDTESYSSDNEIFGNTTVKENNTMINSLAKKRTLEDDEAIISKKKRTKKGPPEKPKEIILSESIKPNLYKGDKVLNPQNSENNCYNKQNSSSVGHLNGQSLDITEIDSNNSSVMKSLYNSDVSMKPSFIKRKLFTQKLDMLDNKCSSNENLTNSPCTRNKYREKNKVRKLVTSQSYLSRDVQDEDNVLELIHKIVPPDQMNVTNATNKSLRNSYEDENRWDVASVISMCNNNNVSDTYTDEEIFTVDKDVGKSKKETTINTKKNQQRITTKCKVVIEKLPTVSKTERQNKKEVPKSKCPKKRTASSCVKSFWDTDFESDVEKKNGLSLLCKPLSNAYCDKVTKDSVINKNHGKKPVRGTMLTVNSLKNTFINSVRNESSHQTSNDTVNEIVESNNNFTVNDSKLSPQKVSNISDTTTLEHAPNKLEKVSKESAKKKHNNHKPFEYSILTRRRLNNSSLMAEAKTPSQKKSKNMESNNNVSDKNSKKTEQTIKSKKDLNSISDKNSRVHRKYEARSMITNGDSKNSKITNKKNETQLAIGKSVKNITVNQCQTKPYNHEIDMNKSMITRSHTKKKLLSGHQRRNDDVRSSRYQNKNK